MGVRYVSVWRISCELRSNRFGSLLISPRTEGIALIELRDEFLFIISVFCRSGEQKLSGL